MIMDAADILGALRGRRGELDVLLDKLEEQAAALAEGQQRHEQREL